MVNKNMNIMEILQIDEAIAGIHCLGCVMAHSEDLEQACAVHGIDADKLVDKINAYLEAK